MARYQRDLPRIRSLGAKAAQLYALFLHRVLRFEVPYELSGKTVHLVVDPHAARVVGVEDGAGVSLGAATPLDMLANIHRTRRKPEPVVDLAPTRSGPNLVELGKHACCRVDSSVLLAHKVRVNRVTNTHWGEPRE